MMHRAPDQPVGVQFAPEHGQLAAIIILQDGLCDTESASKASDDAADCGYLYLRRCIAHQVHLAIADAPPDRHPAAVNRDACALPFERLHVLLFEKARQAAGGVGAVLPDYP